MDGEKGGLHAEQGGMTEEGGTALRAFRELNGEIEAIQNLTHPMLFIRPDGGILALLPRGLSLARVNKELAALLFGVLLDCCAFDSVVTSIGEAIRLAQRIGTVV